VRRFLAAALALAAASLAACTSVPSAAPAVSGSPSSSNAPPGSTVATASPNAPAPPTGGLREPLVVGCLSVDDAECQLLARQIVAVLPPERGPAFAIQIQLFPCENAAAPCPKSLAARAGKAVVEFFDGGDPLDFSVKGPPLVPEIAPQDAFYLGLTNPTSTRVDGPGPFAFEMGHCGVSHVVDFDGSFWVPVGQVDGDHPTIINSESGLMRLIGPSRAEFRGDSGFTVQLARFPGPKHFWGCD
jgi:hypothetical protein